MLAVAGVVHEDVDPAVDLQGFSRRALHFGFGGAGIERVRLGPAQRRGDFGGIARGGNNLVGVGSFCEYIMPWRNIQYLVTFRKGDLC